MAKSNSSSGSGQQALADYRALQEEMLNLSREYSQERLAAWTQEISSLRENWDAFSQEWQGSLGEMFDPGPE